MDNFSCQVLLVEDNEDDYLIVRDLLSDIATTEFALQWVDTYAAARDLLAHHDYDVCLLDYRLGEATGVELMQEFAHSETPFILLTGTEDYAVDVAAAKAGAADYLVKAHINGPLIERSIRYAIERKKMQESLHQERDFISAVVDTVGSLIIVLDRHGRIVRFNRTCEQLTQYSFEEVKNREFWDLFLVPEEVEAVKSNFQELRSGHFPNAYENYWLAKDGSRHLIAWANTALLDAQGAVEYLIGTGTDITERKEGSEAMERLAAIVESSSDAIISKNLEGIITSWNAGAEALYGYSSREAIGRPISMLVPPDRPDEGQRLLSKIARGERVANYETVRVCKDGRRLNISLMLSPLKNEAGKITGASAIARDISERKQAENALRESEERFASIVASVPGMVYQFMLRPDGFQEWPFVSEGCREIYEVEPQTIQRNPSLPDDLIHPDDKDQFIHSAMNSMQTLLPWRWEGRLRPASGKTKWIQTASRPQRLPDGSTLWNGLVMDITARKEAEEERDRFFTLSLDILSIFGLDGTFKRVNPAYLDTLGFVEAELIGKPFLEWVHPGDRAATIGAVETLSGGNTVIGFENRYRRKDGAYRWLEWKAVAVVEEGLIYTAARDITERKQSEAALLQMRDELEVRVQERTAELGQSNATLQAEVLERERAEREVRAQARQHEAVAELGRRALLDTDLDTLLKGAAALVSSTLEVEICSFWECVPDSNILRMRASVGTSYEAQSPPERTIGDDSQLGQTGLLNAPILTEDLEHETGFRGDPWFIKNNIASTLTMPVHDDVLYGVLAVCSPQKQRFAQNEVFFLQTVANVLSSAIARKQDADEIVQLNTNLHGVNEELRANETRLLEGNQISTDLMRLRVGTHDELQVALHQITEAASAMLNIDRSSVWLFNQDRSALRCIDLYERDAQCHSSGIELPEDDNYFPTIKAQRIIAADNAQTDPAMRGYWQDYFQPHGIGSVLDVALVVGGKHIGVFCSEHVGPPRQWQAEDRTFASAVASVCSLVLESYERTRAETALKEAKEEAERATEEANAANAAKSEFLSRMSHELRTPLNAILGFGQILEMRLGNANQASDAKQLGNIQQILKAGRHLLSLINEVLDITRIEAGHLSLSLEPIPVGIVVQESLDLVRPLAMTRRIELDNQVPGEMAALHLLADQQRLKQVLLNLLSNAVKYNREGGQVFVGCEIVAATTMGQDADGQDADENIASGQRLRILVRDTGNGLSAQDIAKLFVPFERLDAAHSQIEGTGIGLTLCKRLVEAMNGQIGIDSEVGQGSTFWIEMPLVSSPLEHAAAQNTGGTEDGVSGDGAASNAERSSTILYIEDNLSNINLIEQVLSEREPAVRLLTAMQGSVGLELALQHAPDLILLDVHLPDIMGDVVLQRLKADAATREIPVVVLSADATASQIERLLAGGAEAYLTKPLDLKQFFKVVEHLLPQPDSTV